jgi:hypothetical protein
VHHSRQAGSRDLLPRIHQRKVRHGSDDHATGAIDPIELQLVDHHAAALDRSQYGDSSVRPRTFPVMDSSAPIQ